MSRWFRLMLVLVACSALVLGPLTDHAAGQTPVVGSRLQSSLDQYVGHMNASYGVYVLDLSNGGRIDVNGEETFPTASMYKLLVMYRVFQAIQNGDLTPGQQITITDDDLAAGDPDAAFATGDTPTVGYALDRMITVSSNAAAYALARSVGGWQSVISAPTDLGMNDTTFTDDFSSTPQDLAHFFHLLSDRSLVSPAASDQMLDLLDSQTINDRIPALLPHEVAVAHKTGELPGVRNDGGIVQCGNERYIVVMMSRDGDPSEEVGTEAELSRMIYDQLCS